MYVVPLPSPGCAKYVFSRGLMGDKIAHPVTRPEYPKPSWAESPPGDSRREFPEEVPIGSVTGSAVPKEDTTPLDRPEKFLMIKVEKGRCMTNVEELRYPACFWMGFACPQVSKFWDGFAPWHIEAFPECVSLCICQAFVARQINPVKMFPQRRAALELPL